MRAAVAIQQLEVLDSISTSQFSRLLCAWDRDSVPQQRVKPCQFKGEFSFVRTDPAQPDLTEARVHLALQPFRINADQDALDFLISFFVPGRSTTSLLPPSPKSSSASSPSSSSSASSPKVCLLCVALF